MQREAATSRYARLRTYGPKEPRYRRMDDTFGNRTPSRAAVAKRGSCRDSGLNLPGMVATNSVLDGGKGRMLSGLDGGNK
jgi:hypothetical protein